MSLGAGADGLHAVDLAAPDQALARAYCVPFAWHGNPALGDLPVDGWDGVIWRSARDRQIGQKPTLISALEITIPTNRQGTGMSARMLAAMRDNAARLGFEHLVAPVRPSRKHLAAPQVPQSWHHRHHHGKAADPAMINPAVVGLLLLEANAT